MPSSTDAALRFSRERDWTGLRPGGPPGSGRSWSARDCDGPQLRFPSRSGAEPDGATIHVPGLTGELYLDTPHEFQRYEVRAAAPSGAGPRLVQERELTPSPADRAGHGKIATSLDLKVTFKPGEAKIGAEVTVGPEKYAEHAKRRGDTGRVRGGT